MFSDHNHIEMGLSFHLFLLIAPYWGLLEQTIAIPSENNRASSYWQGITISPFLEINPIFTILTDYCANPSLNGYTIFTILYHTYFLL